MSVITVLNKGNVPTGPFTRAQVAEKLQRGEISLGDLAFVEGLSQWTPLRDVLAQVDGNVPGGPAPILAPPPVRPPATVPPVYSYAATMQPPAHLIYAGFWIRFAAYLLDHLILFIPILMLGIILGFVVGGFAVIAGTAHAAGIFPTQSSLNPAFPMAIVMFELAIFVSFSVIAWLYYALQESGPHQATFGKRVMGIKVTDMEGVRISFGQATGRYFSKIITGMVPLGFGYIMMVFMDRKQALHDLIASTLVVRS